MDKGGMVVLNQDNPHFDLLADLACDHGLQIKGFGKSDKADFHLLSWESEAEKSHVMAEIQGERICYTLPVPGEHWVFNSLAVLGAISLAGMDVKKAALNLATVEAPSGRGKRYLGDFMVIDESYNANPTSMRAALSVLGKSEQGRKIAVLGDIREFGDLARQRHEELLEPLLENKIDLVFCCGPNMAYLYERLPENMRGAYALTSLDLIPFVLKEIKSGDVISIKASLGTRVKPIVEALLELQKNPLKRVS
jgi:UDP-N-acetylmuramoyl-tripeptide--D-alanyl-D-alanine ligase